MRKAESSADFENPTVYLEILAPYQLFKNIDFSDFK